MNVPDNLVRTVIKDRKGQVWVGSFGRGIFLYSPTGQRIKDFNTYLNFPSNTINQIFEDSQGVIWAATGEGIVQFENKSPWNYKIYQRTEGLANTFIWAITEDENKNIWFSTNQGISCLSEDRKDIYNYDYRDNIPMASFTRSVCKDKTASFISDPPTDSATSFRPIFWRKSNLLKLSSEDLPSLSLLHLKIATKRKSHSLTKKASNSNTYKTISIFHSVYKIIP